MVASIGVGINYLVVSHLWFAFQIYRVKQNLTRTSTVEVQWLDHFLGPWELMLDKGSSNQRGEGQCHKIVTWY